MNYKEIIESKYNREAWQQLLHDIFLNNVSFWRSPKEVKANSRLAKAHSTWERFLFLMVKRLPYMRWNFQTKLTLRETEQAYVICSQKTGMTWVTLVHFVLLSKE